MCANYWIVILFFFYSVQETGVSKTRNTGRNTGHAILDAILDAQYWTQYWTRNTGRKYTAVLEISGRENLYL